MRTQFSPIYQDTGSGYEVGQYLARQLSNMQRAACARRAVTVTIHAAVAGAYGDRELSRRLYSAAWRLADAAGYGEGRPPLGWHRFPS